MFSMINWSNAYWQARQLWTLVAADTQRLGRTLAETIDAARPEWDNARYAPRYATVRANPQRLTRRPY